MRAAIDIGSNSIRMLLLDDEKRILDRPKYFRQVTRLAGGANMDGVLTTRSMGRTLQALHDFALQLSYYSVDKVIAVGTAALRNAPNSAVFLDLIQKQTGLHVEIIDGETEALFSCRGILSVLNPRPGRAVLFDIGGGSTEIVLSDNGCLCLKTSLPLGVVRLIEDYPDSHQRQVVIRDLLDSFFINPLWKKWQQEAIPIELIGTAGTVTTLAALQLAMTCYDGQLVNNLILERSWLEKMAVILPGLSDLEKTALPGMEKGREDVILPGLEIVCRLLDVVGGVSLRVADAGLLEGLLLE